MKLNPTLARQICEQAGIEPPKQSEGDFRAEVIAFAQSHGWLVAAIRPVRIQRANGSVYYETPMEADGTGWPDLFLARPPRTLAVELKSDTGRLSPEQRTWLTALQGGGIETRVWRPKNWPAIQKELRTT